MEERRSSGQRRRVLKGGSIVFNAGVAVDCIVRNISAAGACLEIETPAGIPNDFILVVKVDNLKRDCQVIWRSAKRIGVRFVAVVSAVAVLLARSAIA